MQKLKKMFLVLFVALIGMVAVPDLKAETYTRTSLMVLDGVLITVIESTIYPCDIPMVCDPEYCIEFRYFPPLIPSIFIPRYCGKILLDGDIVASNNVDMDFYVGFDDVVYITANNDAMVAVYELVTGKSVVDDFYVTRNNRTNLEKTFEDNKHYLIQLKMLTEVYHQTFFINNNQLFVGGK